MNRLEFATLAIITSSTAAAADPAMHRRDVGNNASSEICGYFDPDQPYYRRCVKLDGAEVTDWQNDGSYLYTLLTYGESFYDGSSAGSRYVVCKVPRNALSIRKEEVRFSPVVLDPNSPACETNGDIYTYSPWSWSHWDFTEPVTVEGAVKDPAWFSDQLAQGVSGYRPLGISNRTNCEYYQRQDPMGGGITVNGEFYALAFGDYGYWFSQNCQSLKK